MTTQAFRNINYIPKIATGNSQRLEGTPAPDWIAALGGRNVISTGEGNDVILAGVQFVSIEPNEDNSESILTTLLPNADRNRIDAGDGTDYVVTGAGNDFVNLGRGNDTFIDSGGNDRIFAGGGNDRIFAGAGNDLIDASGLGDRFISLGEGNDRILLGIGNTTVLPGTGDDVIISDVSSYRNVRNPFRIAIGPGGGCIMAAVLAFGEVSIVGGTDPNFIAVAAWQPQLNSDSNVIDQPTQPPRVNLDEVRIVTGNGNDTLITGGVKSVINSGGGDDLIYGGVGDDRINAGKGDDFISLGEGLAPDGAEVVIPDALFKSFLGTRLRITGGGNDRIDLGGGQDTVVLNGYQGFVRIYGFGRGDSIEVTSTNPIPGGDDSGIEFVRRGRDTVITDRGRAIGVLKGVQRPA